MANIFLSHSSKDKAIARKIASDLRQKGVEVWLDEWEIMVGDSITQKISHGLDKMDLVAVLLTSNSVNSAWVEKEWQSKIGDEATERKVLILPIRAGDCQIPRLLKDKRYADITEDYEQGFDDLLSAIRAHSSDRTVRLFIVGYNVEIPTTYMCTIVVPATHTISKLIDTYDFFCRTTNKKFRISIETLDNPKLPEIDILKNSDSGFFFELRPQKTSEDEKSPMLGGVVAFDWQTLSPLHSDQLVSSVKPPYIVFILPELFSRVAIQQQKNYFQLESNIAKGISIWINSDNQVRSPVIFYYHRNGYVRAERFERTPEF